MQMKHCKSQGKIYRKMLLHQHNREYIILLWYQTIGLMHGVDTKVTPFTNHSKMQVMTLNCVCTIVHFFLPANTFTE